MSAIPQFAEDPQIQFTEWLQISPPGHVASPGRALVSHQLLDPEGTPVQQNYIYPPPYLPTSDLKRKDSPFSDPSSYPTSVSPFIFSSRIRMNSFDSNATLLATPSPISRFSFASSVTVTPLSPVLSSTPFEAGYSFEEIWIPCDPDISPVVRGGGKAGPSCAPEEENSSLRDIPSFMDRLRAVLPSVTSANTTPLTCEELQPTSPMGAGVPSTPTSFAKVSEPLSPLTPLTSPASIASSYLPPSRRKRNFEETNGTNSQSKRARREIFAKPKTKAEKTPVRSPLSAHNINIPSPIYTRRTFPSSIDINSTCELFYRCFPVSSYFRLHDSESPCAFFNVEHPGGNYNPPRESLDLYTPRFVKGKGVDKVGLCPICIEPHERGGEDKKVWLAMKFSAFKCYHMQYAHGISASTGRPFSPPIAFRIFDRPGAGKKQKTKIQQGKCHKCSKWIAIEGIKDVEVKVKELFWWKHAAVCHHDSTLPGEGEPFEDDSVLKMLLGLKAFN